ncbi:MAG TPA: hypothetical protein VHA57_03460 [Actinomycetota bacterium]|nr:hypothetical protein [Actinomycetota bacterium]
MNVSPSGRFPQLPGSWYRPWHGYQRRSDGLNTAARSVPEGEVTSIRRASRTASVTTLVMRAISR